MHVLFESWQLLNFGGPLIWPLLLLAVLMVAILLDKTYVYWRYTRPPSALRHLLADADVAWSELDHYAATTDPNHHYVRFLRVILKNRQRPAWWTESRAGDESLAIEHVLGRGLWVLETIVTAAPLLGLLGTIYGMMHAFHLFGANGLVDPKGVTSGVATALIATAVGLAVALVALFGFNYFSRLQARTLDELERMGTRLLDRARLESETGEVAHEAA